MKFPKIRESIPATLAALLVLSMACGREAEGPPAGAAAGESGTPPEKKGDFLLARAALFLSDGQADEAVAVLEQARRLDSGSAKIAIALGRAYLKDDRFAAARRILEETLRSSSTGPALRTEARQVLVEDLLHEGDLRQAHEACEPLLRADPDSAVSHRLAGTIAYREGDTQKARKELTEAVRLAPEDADARTAMGLVLLQSGDLQSAAESLEAAVRLDPESASALSNLAKVYERQGRKSEAGAARTSFQRLYDRKSVRQKVGTLRARGVEAYNAGRFPEALESFRAILRIAPRDPQALSHAGSVLLQMQRLDEAEEYLSRSTEVRPDNDFAWRELGRLRVLRHDLPLAIEMFRRAIRANPYAPEPHYFLAGVYYAQGRREEFLKEKSAFDQLRRSSPTGPMISLPAEPTR